MSENERKELEQLRAEAAKLKKALKTGKLKEVRPRVRRSEDGQRICVLVDGQRWCVALTRHQWKQILDPKGERYKEILRLNNEMADEEAKAKISTARMAPEGSEGK
jgi:hypothetical protein